MIFFNSKFWLNCPELYVYGWNWAGISFKFSNSCFFYFHHPIDTESVQLSWWWQPHPGPQCKNNWKKDCRRKAWESYSAWRPGVSHFTGRARYIPHRVTGTIHHRALPGSKTCTHSPASLQQVISGYNL